MTVSVDIGTLIAVLSTLTAVVSLIFAWRAVKVAERSNLASIFTELHKIYQAPETFSAIKTVWGLYNQYEGSNAGSLISPDQAVEIVSTFDRDSAEWKAIHDMDIFWKYVSILVRRRYLDEELAFESFTSPRMLGFLAPIEQAFLEYHYSKPKTGDQLPMMWLYNRWKAYVEQK